MVMVGTGQRACALTLRASAYSPRVPSQCLLFDKTPGTSRKPSLEESRGFSVPGPGDEEEQSAPGISHFRAMLSKMMTSGKGASLCSSTRSYIAMFFPAEIFFFFFLCPAFSTVG